MWFCDAPATHKRLHEQNHFFFCSFVRFLFSFWRKGDRWFDESLRKTGYVDLLTGNHLASSRHFFNHLVHGVLIWFFQAANRELFEEPSQAKPTMKNNFVCNLLYLNHGCDHFLSSWHTNKRRPISREKRKERHTHIHEKWRERESESESEGGREEKNV